MNNFNNIGGMYISFQNCTGLEEVTLGNINQPVSKINQEKKYDLVYINNV